MDISVIETRSETVARLRRWGVWRTAQLAMADRREKLRAEGYTRKEARELAWTFVRDAFPEHELREMGVVDWDDLLDEVADEMESSTEEDLTS